MADMADMIEDPDNAKPAGVPAWMSQVEPAPDRDLYQLAAQLKLKTDPDDIPRIVNPNPVEYLPGQEDTFWLVNFRNLSVYQSDFKLLGVSPHAYWYFEEGQPVPEADLEKAIQNFEDIIYPRVSHAFGREWSPGIDNDPHLNIIHARIEGVAGYFSSADEHPRIVYPYSNQRETIYINVPAMQVGANSYLQVLAHELQHAIHWNNDDSEDTWVNEGLSELAITEAGYRATSINQFLAAPAVSLIHWPLDHHNIIAHYGGAALFFHYLAEHYSQEGILKELVQEPADGIAGIDKYLANQGYDATFNDVFADWVVANVLDDPSGRYGYADLDVHARVTPPDRALTEINSVIPQYSTEYFELAPQTGPVRLKFQGPTEAALLPTDVGEQGCWWSNSGDSISSALTRSIDLRGRGPATLGYQVWYQIEQNWDYGYVQVSVDQGRTWEILATPHTSPENPIGNGFGPGYTGDSREWLDERVDLADYAGQQLQVRFQYVTDDAINGAGLCLRNISVSDRSSPDSSSPDSSSPDALSPDASGPASGETGDWQSSGFVKTNNRVKQDYIVQLMQIGPENQVSALPLDQSNSGEMVIELPPTPDRLVVAVSALAPITLQPAPFTLTIEDAE
jgi:hypothetical protein